MALRLWGHPIEAFGADGAQYIEHRARLEMLTQLRAGLNGNILEALVALDGAYPPGLHLVEIAWGAVFGHSAVAVLWLGFVWWVALALAVGVLARRLVPGGVHVGLWCGVAMLCVPAVQATALRSYYDLPMTVLLWWALVVLVGSHSWRGVGAGVLWVGAVLIKWTALPFGAVMVGAWMLVGDKRAVRSGLTALSVVGCWTVVFLGAGAESFATMGRATFQTSVDFGLEHLGFYLVRLISTVLSPVGAVLSVVAMVLLWRSPKGGPGKVSHSVWALFGLIAGGHLAFLCWVVPVMDDRFILSLVPGIVLLVGVGLAQSPRLAVVAAVAMFGVAVDAHWPSSPTNIPDGDGWPTAKQGRVWVPRLGMSSSVERRGWSRSSDMRPDKTAQREALWLALLRCGGGRVGGDDTLISGAGDGHWWQYRRLLSQLSGEAEGVVWVGDNSPSNAAPKLWVGLSQPGGGPSSSRAPSGFKQVADVGPWAVWGQAGVKSCIE